MNPNIPIPPPPPGWRGGPPGGPPGGHPPGPPGGFPPPGGMRPGPPNHQGQGGGPPPQNQQFNLPTRPAKVNSSKIVDITPPRIMDEAASRKKLTTYAVYTVKKAIPRGKELPTWARAEVTEERLDQADIAKQVKRLNEKSSKSVAEQKTALAPNQQGQVVKVLDELISKERDSNFIWSLVQIDKEERIIKVRKPSSSKRDSSSNKRETTTLTIYAMRAPQPHVNCKMLNELIEKHRVEMLVQQNRPSMPNQQGPGNMQHNNNGPPPRGNSSGPGGPGFVTMPPRNNSPGRRGKSKSPGPTNRRGSKKYHDSGSDGSDSDSAGSDSESTRSSSNATTISSKGHGRTGRRNSHSKAQNRSYSRHRPEHAREHKKKYYVEDSRDPSPRRPFDDMLARQPLRPPFVPEVHRGIPEPGFDAVAAAYQAGKIDADAERFGLNERYIPPPRAIERPVIIEQPRAVVSYGRRESFAGHPNSPPRITQARYSPPVISPRLLPERYAEGRLGYRDFRPESRGYGFDRREFRPEPRSYRPEHRASRDYPSDYHDELDSERSFSPEPPRFRGVDYHSRERDAEEYIDRERPVFERPPFHRRVTEPRIPPIRNDHHPFAPLRRRYSPSTSTTDSGGW
ncbi:hypothetical protein GLAREA_03085 [Glarea lozoyensis ATCC 20868]|uniref:Uncharacterized protein n=1 Tax=Glarea lozoyensis (strain ATCC 20868 / MF5171) TaxID=1116229 RepID=S3D521_GLAL2|nr:uncharacterized protein GLAREA_03085 [Glarea lozoyensis ATCC 20868]EPE27171.1 hypothetical protein GLAREA_03085 [Glarea lozoyensis ATCC 20868]